MKIPADFTYAFHSVHTPATRSRPLQCVMIGCHGLASTRVEPSEGQIRYLCANCAKVVARFPQQAEFVYLMTHSSVQRTYASAKSKGQSAKRSRAQLDYMRAAIPKPKQTPLYDGNERLLW